MAQPTTRRSFLLATGSLALLTRVSDTAVAQSSQTVRPSPSWVRAMPRGPLVPTRITENYAELVGRDAYFWTWPLINIYNRRVSVATAPGIVEAQLGLKPDNWTLNFQEKAVLDIKVEVSEGPMLAKPQNTRPSGYTAKAVSEPAQK